MASRQRTTGHGARDGAHGINGQEAGDADIPGFAAEEEQRAL